LRPETYCDYPGALRNFNFSTTAIYEKTKMLNTNAQKIVICSLATALLGFGQNAAAHTSIQNKVNDSSTTYNNIVIGHTCTTTASKKIPVVAQSVVFPTVNPVLTTGTGAGTVSSLTVGDIITSTAALANVPQLIQSNDIFSRQSEKTDSSSNVIGFNSYKGSLGNTLHGLVPFRTAGITFKSSANSNTDSCVTKLTVKVAIADICKNTFPPKEGTANLWIPNVTTKFPNAVDGTDNGTPGERLGSPASLVINRDLTTNPLDSSCNDTGLEVTVWPSDEDIDANLAIPGVWGK
jgi:hypothetical protein